MLQDWILHIRLAPNTFYTIDSQDFYQSYDMALDFQPQGGATNCC